MALNFRDLEFRARASNNRRDRFQWHRLFLKNAKNRPDVIWSVYMLDVLTGLHFIPNSNALVKVLRCEQPCKAIAIGHTNTYVSLAICRVSIVLFG